MSTSSGKNSIRQVTAQEARGKDVVLVDVRTPVEFESAHIEGAVSRPLDGFDAREVAELAHGKVCVVTCHSGGRARRVAES